MQTILLFGIFSIVLIPMSDKVFAETVIADFVDPNKDQQYYLDRYYNELT